MQKVNPFDRIFKKYLTDVWDWANMFSVSEQNYIKVCLRI